MVCVILPASGEHISWESRPDWSNVFCRFSSFPFLTFFVFFVFLTPFFFGSPFPTQQRPPRFASTRRRDSVGSKPASRVDRRRHTRPLTQPARGGGTLGTASLDKLHLEPTGFDWDSFMTVTIGSWETANENTG